MSRLVRRGGAGPSPEARDPTGALEGGGWVVVFAVAAILMATSSSRFLFGVVLKPVSEDFGWDRASLTGAVMLGMVTLSACQPLVGMATDHVGPKRILVAGTVVTGLALLSLSGATALWHVYALYGVAAAIGLAATSPVIATSLTGRWFGARRGAAMAIATSGSAFGQLLIVPLATWTLTLTDWQTTYRLLGAALLAVMVPIGILALRDAPAGAARQPAVARDGRTLRAALGSRPFWLLAFGFVTCGFTMAFPSIHFLAYADDMGMATTDAANAVAVTAAFSIAGSVLLGFAGDRWRRSWVLAGTYLLRGAAFALLLVPGNNLLMLYAVVLGISWTATTPLTAAITADVYGPRHLGAIFGTMFVFMNLGIGVGSFLDGVVYDLTGDYRAALAANAVLGLAAAIAVRGVLDGGRRLAPAASTPQGGTRRDEAAAPAAG